MTTWDDLAKIGTSDKWIKMYAHYQDLLIKDDVAAWWQDQYVIANNERNELKSKYEGKTKVL